MRRFWTIRVRFLTFALVSLVPLIGFNWWMLNTNTDARNQDLTSAQTVISSQITNSLTGFLSTTFKGMESLAGSSTIVEMSDTDLITTILGQARTLHPEFIGIFVLDTEGQLVTQAGIVDSSVLESIPANVDGVLASGQRSLSGRIDLPLDPTTSVFVMLVPITTTPDASATSQTDAATPEASEDSEDSDNSSTISPGAVTGVMGTIVSTDTLNQIAIPPSRGRAEMVILSGHQIVTATGDTRSNEEAYIQNLVAQTSGMFDEGTDVFRMKSLSATERLAIWTQLPLESTNWSTLVTSPIPQSQYQNMWQQLMMALAVTALIYIALAYTYGELASRSLSDLSESARRLAGGDYRTPISARGAGEFAELRESLIQLRRNTEEVMSLSEEQQAERQHQNQQLRDLLRRDLRIQEDERRHIASEIHDAISPLITGALYQSRALQRANGGATSEQVGETLTDVNNLLERASQELHGIIFDLRPPDLDELGVVAAIQAYVNTIQRTGLQARLEVLDEPPPLSPEIRLGIYRIVQEALHNVLRHSGADEAVVRLEYVNELLRVTIRDNGTGFNPESARRPTSLGLLSMRERAASIDADFEVLSRPGGGTVIIVERRDTGGVMSDAMLEALLRDRAMADVETDAELADNGGNEPA